MSIENVTWVTEYADGWQLGSKICLWVTFGFCILGLFNNLLCALVFAQRTMRNNALHIFLLALSVADFFVALFTIPVFLVHRFIELSIDALRPLAPGAVATIGLYYLALSSHFCAGMLYVAISWERFQLVCFPLSAYHCRIRTAAKLSLSIALIAGIYNLPRLWEYRYAPSVDGLSAPSLVGYLKESRIYMMVYVTVMYSIFKSIIPFTVIGIFNACIIRAILRSDRARQTMTIRQHSEQRKAWITLVLTFMFVGSNLPPTLLNIAETNHVHQSFHNVTSDGAIIGLGSYGKVSFLNDFSNLLVIVNSSVTFFIYYFYMQRFKITVGQLRRGELDIYSKNGWVMRFIDIFKRDRHSGSSRSFRSARCLLSMDTATSETPNGTLSRVASFRDPLLRKDGDQERGINKLACDNQSV